MFGNTSRNIRNYRNSYPTISKRLSIAFLVCTMLGLTGSAFAVKKLPPGTKVNNTKVTETYWAFTKEELSKLLKEVEASQIKTKLILAQQEMIDRLSDRVSGQKVRMEQLTNSMLKLKSEYTAIMERERGMRDQLRTGARIRRAQREQGKGATKLVLGLATLLGLINWAR